MSFVGNEVPYQSALPANSDNKERVDLYFVVLPLDDDPVQVGPAGIEPTSTIGFACSLLSICRRAGEGNRTPALPHTKGMLQPWSYASMSGLQGDRNPSS